MHHTRLDNSSRPNLPDGVGESFESVADEHAHVLTTSELEYESANRGALSNAERIDCPGSLDLATMLERFRGRSALSITVDPTTVAFLTYTSGTTGPPKGAMTTHRNVTFNAQTYRDRVGIGIDDVILGIAPLFHVTGLVGHIALSLLTGAPLVLTYRMDAVDTVETIRQQRATFTVGSITAFIALMNAENANRETLGSLTKIYSGGAPIPPRVLAMFEDRFGHYIHNIYGLTETTSPALCVPFGTRTPHKALTGATSVGVPVYDTVARIIDDNGNELPAGEVGEIVITGPQVVAGYWNKPEATADSIPAGGLHTGDIGYMDRNGWFYLIDRKRTRSMPVVTKCGLERSRTYSTNTRPSAKPRWSVCPTHTAVRRSRRSSASIRECR